MRSFIRSLRSALIRREWRRRFPTSVIHSGVAISADCSLGRHTVFFSGATLHSSDVGAYSYIQANTAIFNAEIGPFCSIASHVTIGLAAHPTSMVSTSPVFYDNGQPLPRFFTRGREFTDNLPRTRIGADVWIGQAAMIKAGVTIGVGAVIGAGALVTRDIAPYMIVGGVPCRPIRSRFSDAIVLRLRESRWWELPEGDLEALADTFLDPTEFLSAFTKRRVGDDRTAR